MNNPSVLQAAPAHSLSRESIRLELRVDGASPGDFTLLFARHAARGITFQRLDELQVTAPRWLDTFTRLDNDTRSSSGDPQVPRTSDAMRARLGELAFDAAACFVACDRARWVGYTLLDSRRSTPERIRQSWTGVIPEYRRRGIATALKALTVRYAHAGGYAFIETVIRRSNIAAWSMNERIGLRPAPSR